MNQEKMDTCTSRFFLRVTRRTTKHTSLVQITGRESVDDSDCELLDLYYDPGENATTPAPQGKPL
jgi:hypothetical protein